VGYFISGIKSLDEIKIGDTITGAKDDTTPVPGFREIKPFVFSSFYPIGDTTEKTLREAIMKLNLNDASFTWEPEQSQTLGGKRIGNRNTRHRASGGLPRENSGRRNDRHIPPRRMA